ncbi:hypothetical protein D3C80_1495140 [compost metagenome]
MLVCLVCTIRKIKGLGHAMRLQGVRISPTDTLPNFAALVESLITLGLVRFDLFVKSFIALLITKKNVTNFYR